MMGRAEVQTFGNPFREHGFQQPSRTEVSWRMNACETKKRKSVDTFSGSTEVAQHETLKVPSLLDIRWNTLYQHLYKVFQERGPCDIPLSYVVASDDGRILKLGSWLGTQRRLYRKNALSVHKKEQLQVLVNKGWISWGPIESKSSNDEANWNAKYSQLLEYGKNHGHYNVSAKFTISPGLATSKDAELTEEEEEEVDPLEASEQAKSSHLGKWLERQRHGMRTHTLSGDRTEKLQKLVDSGRLVVDSSAEGERSWQRHFAALMEYAQTYQHCDVPYGYEVEVEVPSSTESPAFAGDRHDTLEGGPSKGRTEVLRLGHWLSNQRHAHNRANRCLRADRAAQLQALVDRGLLKWRCEQLTREQKWDEMYEWLLKYCEDHAWMAAGTPAPPPAPAASPSVTVHAPAASTAAGVAARAGTNVGTDENADSTCPASASVPGPVHTRKRRLLPFSGSAELSDGSSVSLCSWLQRQLSALPEPDAEHVSCRESPPPSDKNVVRIASQLDTQRQEGKAAVKPAKDVSKKKLNPECVAKIMSLLAKGEGVFCWQGDSVCADV